MNAFAGKLIGVLADFSLVAVGFYLAIFLYFLQRTLRDHRRFDRLQANLVASIILFGLSVSIASRVYLAHAAWSPLVVLPFGLFQSFSPWMLAIIAQFILRDGGESRANGLSIGKLTLIGLACSFIPLPAYLAGGWFSLLLLGPFALWIYAGVRFAAHARRNQPFPFLVSGVSGFVLCALGQLTALPHLATGDSGLAWLWALGLWAVQLGACTVVVGFVTIEERQARAASEEVQQELDFVLHHDPLTGLYNRDVFLRRLDERIDQVRAGGQPLALLLVDLDHFRTINDSLGAPVGDLLLISVAEQLTCLVADTERVFRVGEDEFAILVPCDDSHAEATRMAEAVLASFNRSYRIQGSEVFLTASIGITFADRGELQSAPTTGELCQRGDTALRQAKLDRNTYRFFSPILADHSLGKLQYFNYLRQAIDRSELSLHFQPQVDREGRVVSAEALLRWHNPVLGSVPPSEFIPVAEEAGLIIPIGDWVIERACAELAHWRSNGLDIPLAINISPRQLKDVRLEHQLLSRVKKYGLRPEMLHLEITESSLIADTDRTLEVLDDLARAGFSLSIDDFGTGYANLSWLKRLPVDTLKIDRSFVVDMPHNEQDLAMVQAIISIAKCRGLSTIAEGVDDQSQLDLLHAADCHIIQGFFYSRPLPSEEFIGFVRRQAS